MNDHTVINPDDPYTASPQTLFDNLPDSDKAFDVTYSNTDDFLTFYDETYE
jgi:hypothetical protein